MQSLDIHRILGTLLVLAGLCVSTADGDEPEWVKKRPIVQGFYVGIGMAQKNRPAAEYTGAARNVALNDIASQITVSVSSDVLRTVLEKNEQIQEEFQSLIRASATADLDGVQLIDTYENDREYWLYCRLSRSEYEARRSAKLNAASTRSLDLYIDGTRNEREGNVARALGLYAQAFGPIERYLAEPLTVQIGGRSAYLVNELYGSLRTLLDRIEIRTAGGTVDAKMGRPLRKPLELRALLRDSGATPVGNLPFRFRFVRGGGEYVDRAETDKSGTARCAVQKITAPDRTQLIEAKLDLQALGGGESVTPVVRTVLGSFTLPGARFMLDVTGVEVIVRSDESMFGEPLQQKRIEPLVKSDLGAKGFSFVDDASKAALAITIKADVRKGSESFGLSFAFASATVSVLDLETGLEIYKGSVVDVKEGSDSFEKAGYRSLNSVGKRIAGEVLPRLVEEVQK